MFRMNTDDKTAGVDAEATSGVPSVISKGVSFKGDLISDGDVMLEGVIKGNVRCFKIIIGDGAKLNGIIVAETVVVLGSIKGSVWSPELSLESSAQVEGDINYNHLTIEHGACFDGTSQRLKDPLAEAPDLKTKTSRSMGTTRTTKDSSKAKTETPSKVSPPLSLKPMDVETKLSAKNRNGG